MTGREYLFSLDDTQLAKFLYNRCSTCIYLTEVGICGAFSGQDNCMKGRVQWLKQEYKGNEHKSSANNKSGREPK